MEINTVTNISEHNGDTFVGSHLPPTTEDAAKRLNFNENIQINISSTSAVVIEAQDRVPQIIIQNMAPTISLTKEQFADLQVYIFLKVFMERSL